MRVNSVARMGVLLVASVPVWADFSTPTYFASGTSASAGNTISGNASFSFVNSSGLLTITVNNTSPQIISVGDVLTGVGFEFAGGSGSYTLSAPATTGTTGYNCPDTHPPSACGAATTVTPIAWKSDVATGVLGGYSNNISSFTGTPKGSAVANNHIVGRTNGSFHDSPFLKGPVTFTLTVTGNTAGITGISSVFLAFNTDGSGLTATATPEPGFYGVLAVGMFGLLLLHARRRKTS